MINREYCGRINDLGTVVTQFHGLNIAQLINHICFTDHSRISRHKTVNIRPYFEHICI